MRLKIILAGNDPSNLLADRQLLRDRNFLVFNCLNITNLPELITEVQPDIVFIDVHHPDAALSTAFDSITTDWRFDAVPVIYTLAKEGVYLVVRKRSEITGAHRVVADNIADAVKMALESPVNKRAAPPGKPPTGRQGPSLSVGFTFR